MQLDEQSHSMGGIYMCIHTKTTALSEQTNNSSKYLYIQQMIIKMHSIFVDITDVF